MKTELIDVSATQKEIKIEIDAAAVKTAYNKVSQKYASAANVPGFRKGNAPLDVVRVRFRDEINNEVLQEIIPKAVSGAIEEHELHPLAEPQLHLENSENMKLNGSQPVSLHVHVEVMPEIPTPEYKGLEVTRRVKPTDDAQIEDLISKRLNEQAALIPVENRKSQTGDTVIVDLEGTIEGESEGEPIRAEDLEIPLGDESIDPSFSENLAGVEPDEEKEFTVVYPADFSSPALAGKTVHYKAKVKSVGAMETPELNDEWAKSLDEGYESLDDLRSKLRADLETYGQTDADARLRNEAIAKFIEKHDFEIPNALIEVQARNLLNNFAQDLQQRGVDLNKVEKEFVQMAYNQMQTQAERDVRGAMLLEKVAELENVEVSDAEVADEIQKMADYYRATPEEIRASLAQQQGGEDNIKNNLRTRKAIEALITHANVTEGEWVDENLAQQNVETESAEPVDAETATATLEAEAESEKAAKKKTAAENE
ncbi:MAG TPA: trigger factor [Pyrinomonadaceae bacterium]|jgi:trigger factor